MEFIRAVNKLADIPSRQHENGTMYDDFAVLHGAIGSWGVLKVSVLQFCFNNTMP